MDVISKLKEDAEKTLLELKKWTKDYERFENLLTAGAELAAVFGKLKKAGQNTTDGIVKWMKEVKLIASKETEDQVRTELNTAPDTKDIKFTHFRETVFKLVDDRRKELEGVGTAIREEGGKLAAALRAGTSAFEGALVLKDSKTRTEEK